MGGREKYQSPFQQGSRAEGVPPLDLRVPAGEDAGARGLRALGDTSGRLARLTAEQHLDRGEERKQAVPNERGPLVRSLRTPAGKLSSRRRRPAPPALRTAFKVYRSQLDRVSFILGLVLALVALLQGCAARARERPTSDHRDHRLSAVRGRRIWRLCDGVYVAATSGGTALTRPRLTPPPALPASALSGIFSTVA